MNGKQYVANKGLTRSKMGSSASWS